MLVLDRLDEAETVLAAVRLADQDAAWADEHVRDWHKNDYQAEPIRIARLVEGARKGE